MRPLPACTHGSGALGRNQRPLSGVWEYCHLASGNGPHSPRLFAPPCACLWPGCSPAFHGRNARAAGFRWSCHAPAGGFPWRRPPVGEYVRWWISATGRSAGLSLRAPGTAAGPRFWAGAAESRLWADHFGVHASRELSATFQSAGHGPGQPAKWFSAAAPPGRADTFHW
jgi:hypothetical protein